MKIPQFNVKLVKGKDGIDKFVAVASTHGYKLYSAVKLGNLSSVKLANDTGHSIELPARGGAVFNDARCGDEPVCDSGRCSHTSTFNRASELKRYLSQLT
jgi:hypothetical protein